MEYQKLATQMINFNKTMFENSYTGMTILQNYSENALDSFWGQFPWVSEENKKSLSDTFALMKKNREEYKQMVEQGFEKWEKFAAQCCK